MFTSRLKKVEWMKKNVETLFQGKHLGPPSASSAVLRDSSPKDAAACTPALLQRSSLPLRSWDAVAERASKVDLTEAGLAVVEAGMNLWL